MKIVKIFIGSPGGLADERQAAKRIIDEINQSHSEYWGCQIKLVGWELTLPGYSRAQSLINQDLDKCQYFVGILWNHWGSQPDPGKSRYSSGFHEEFSRAEGHVESGLMSDIFLFFKDIPEIQLRDLGPSVKQVIDFREQCIRRKKPLFKQFKETVDFDPLFRSTIEHIGWRESPLLAAQEAQSMEAEQPSSAKASKAATEEPEAKLLEAGPAKFIAELTVRPAKWDATPPVDIARLRLIAASVGRAENDDLYLGTHDANLIFLRRSDIDLSDRERLGLIDAGIVGFEYQTTPLWHWLAISDQSGFERLKLLAVIGSSSERRNAIRLLQRLGQSTPEVDKFFTRERTIKQWLGRSEAPADVSAALDFLSTNGEELDADILENALGHVETDKRETVIFAILSILSRKNTALLRERLISLNPGSIPNTLLKNIFANPSSIPTELLNQFINLSADSVRRNTAQLLRARKALSAETAEGLLTDGDFETRLIAIEALADMARAPSDETISAALRKPKPGGLIGLGTRSFARWDDELLDTYKRDQLLKLGYDELHALVEAAGIYDYLEIAALYRGYAARAKEHIRHNVDDLFKSYFDKKMEEFTQRYGEDSKIVADTRGLLDFLKRRLVKEALEALCSLGEKSDIELVRSTLDSEGIDFSTKALGYLGRFGDWSDFDRILKMKKHRFSLAIYMGDDGRDNSIAAALYEIGRERVIDLLDAGIDVSIRRELMVLLPKSRIAIISNDAFRGLLMDKDDQLRKITSIRCAQCLSKSRLSKLLSEYIDHDGTRYYNVVHWLDLGVSMQPGAVAKVVNFELAELKSAP